MPPPNPRKAPPKKLVIREKAPPSDTSSSELSTSEDESPVDPHSPPRHVPKISPLRQPFGHQTRPSLTRIQSAPPGHGTSRASIASIQTFDSQDTQMSLRDDPFFRSYQSPTSVRYAKETSARQAMEASGRQGIDATIGRQSRRGSETTIKTDEKQRKPSLSESFQEYFPEGDVHASMREINIAVIGAAGVGKTTFIQRAHDLRLPPKSAVSVRSLAVYGVVHGIRMIELEFTDDLLSDDRRVVWPKRVGGELLPPVDGVLAMYDVMNEDSISRLPDLLEALVKSNLPTLLVSCKCDIPPGSRQIDPNVIEQVGTTFGGVEAFQTSMNVPETQKKCLGHMLRLIVQRRRDFPRQAARRRANSTVNSGRPVSPTAPGHVRHGSEASGINGRQTQSDSYRDPRQTGRRGSAADANPVPSYDKGLAVVSELPFKSSDGAKGVYSFLDMGEERDEPKEEEKYVPDDVSLAEMPAKNQGAAWDDLVDRLLAQPLTKADKNFATVFLALFRKFAAPGDLLEGIISRFSKISSDDNPHLIKMTSQLRYLDILTIWLQLYPGDFSYSKTRNKLKQFTEHIATNRVFAVAAKEMRANLEVYVEDEDNVWGKTDADKYSSTVTDASFARRHEAEDAAGEKRASDTSTSTMPAHSRSSSQALLSQQEEPTSLAARIAITKEQYKTFMEIPDDEVAGELTRFDWSMFSTFRPRDIIRHISMSAIQREKNRSVECVERMTRQFNHTAYWVSHMILLRDKPKHRAAILEKFMRVAKKLRTLNNYNSLGAVIAGIKGNAVHRLTHTRELVAQPVLREFMKWEILMGTQKSHFAYRLAWENSTGERIPFLPLLRRDLTSTEEGNRTFIGPNDEKINWKKFEIMGEVILGIQRSQAMPYHDLPRSLEVERLLVENSVSGDDDELMSRFQELHERSVQLEGPGGVLNDPSGKKKFPWRWNQN